MQIYFSNDAWNRLNGGHFVPVLIRVVWTPLAVIYIVTQCFLYSHAVFSRNVLATCSRAWQRETQYRWRFNVLGQTGDNLENIFLYPKQLEMAAMLNKTQPSKTWKEWFWRIILNLIVRKYWSERKKKKTICSSVYQPLPIKSHPTFNSQTP